MADALRVATWWALRLPAWLLATLVFRLRVTGSENAPKSGGYLLLGNHTSTFDAVWVAWPTGRPVRFMASADMFRSPIAAFFLNLLGAYPKETMGRDDASMRHTTDLLRSGQIVQINPEGLRTWDGRLLPIRVSTGRFVKEAGVPVVCARIETGHLFWPRWARFPRWVPVRVTLSPPRTWPADADAERILADIVRDLTIDPAPDLSGERTRGWRTAEGLPELLWACPSCFAVRALVAHGDVAGCRRCGATLAARVDGRIDGPSGVEALPDVCDRILAHFGDPPRDPDAPDGVVLSAPDGRLRRRDDPGPERRGLVLTETHLRDDVDSIALSDVVGLTMDVGNVLLVRTRAGVRYRVEPHQPVLLWDRFLQRHVARASGA